MKYKTLAVFSIFTFLSLNNSPFVLASTNIRVENNATSSKTEINVESNTGNNTICQNGKCTTTQNNGDNKVCINGKCYVNENKNIVETSENGKTKIIIQQSNSSNKNMIDNKIEKNATHEGKSKFNKDSKFASKAGEIKEKVKEFKKSLKTEENSFRQIINSLTNFFKSLRFF